MTTALRTLFIFILMLTTVMLTNTFATEDSSDSVSSLEEEVVLQEGSNGNLLISLALYDANTGRSQTAFHPGDEVRYKIKVNVPSEAENQKATVSLHAQLKVGGMLIPFNFSNGLSGLVSNPTGESLELPLSKVFNGTFKIPGNTPKSRLGFSANIAVEGVGTASLGKMIVIKP